MLTELVSPPIVDHGEVPDDIIAKLTAIATSLPPTDQRNGLKSTKIIIGDNEAQGDLHDVAVELGERFLGEKPGKGSDVRLRYVTDADAFRADPRGIRANTHWHHDFKLTEKGFRFLKGTKRLLIPVMKGPLFAVGTLGFEDARIVGPADVAGVSSDEILRNGGPIIIGRGGVLVKSEVDPLGGKIEQAAPGHAYTIPKDTAHRAIAKLPTGRLLFRMDARVR